MTSVSNRTIATVLLAGFLAGTPIAIATAWSQESLSPPHRRAAKHAHGRGGSNERALTVTRPPQGVYAEPYVGGDPSFLGQDSEDAYGNITGFNPEPYITSGVQYPYGLDGVGGWGSDLGFEGEQSSSVYQRASGSP